MPYIPRKVVPGKHYAIYTESGKAKVKTKAAVLKEALGIALEKAEHAEWIDFIPAKFTLQCFDKETEILTDSGWKKFYELAEEDKVAQVRNVKGFTLEFVKPLKIWTQDYEGEMIGIRNDYIDVLVNPEHRFFVKNGTTGRGWQFRAAKVCYGKKIRLNPGSVRWDGLFCGHPRWFELLGFFFADGSYRLKGEGKSNNYSLTFTQKNKKEYLENLLSELGLKIQKISREPEGTILFKIDNKGLGLFFSQFGKRERKQIPSFIRNASPELLRSFLIGYSNGDGYRREGDWRLGGSKQIIDALQEIAIKAGFPARVRVEKPSKGSFSNKPKHTLSISKGSIKWVTVNPQDWYKVNYKDRIYSVKVPSGVILIRRNGKPSLQGNCHGWFKEDPKEGYTNLKQIQDVIKSALKSGKDPVKELKGKWHYDLRIQKATAPTWFGLTFFSEPFKGTPEEKTMGTVKGYQSIAPGGKKLQEFLLERAEKEMAKEGIAERRDRLEWMKIKAQWFPIDSPGNPQKYEPAAMIAIEFFKPACLHRRTLRFLDITFFGDYLKGRYFNRLVERKLNEDELMEWQKEAIKKGQAKEFYQLNFYFWKAKEQWGQPGTKYSMKDVYQAALGKKTLDPLPAPPSKEVEVEEGREKEKKAEKKIKPPLATKVFH